MSVLNNKYALEDAVVVLYNPVAQMRATLREAMHAHGFRDIYDFGDLTRARTAVVERAPDLVLLDLDRDVAGICNLVREVRQSGIAADPFVIIIALSWHPNIEAVNNSLEAGIDDLIIMPVSVKSIGERIDILIRARKDFIVTSSYIGPDRRKAEDLRNDPLGLGTIKVPNNLRYKATGDAEAQATAVTVAAIQSTVNTHRVNRYAQRIVWLVDQTLKLMDEGKEVRSASMKRLDDVERLVDALATDLEAQGNTTLREICDSMTRVIENIRGTPTRRYYDLLKVHGLAASATLLGHADASNLVIGALNEARVKLARSQSA